MSDEKFVRKNITIRRDQAEWIEKNAINLSRFVQIKIDELMKERRDGV